MNEPYTYIFSLLNLPPISFPIPPLQVDTEPLFEFPQPYSKFLLAISFTFGNVSFHVTLSIHLTVPPLSQIYSLSLLLHCCTVSKFFSTIFLDSIYMHENMIFISLFLTHFTLCNRSRFIHLIRTDSNAVLFMAEQYSIVYMYHSFFIHSPVNPKVSRREIIKIKAEINEIELKKTIAKINETES